MNLLYYIDPNISTSLNELSNTILNITSTSYSNFLQQNGKMVETKIKAVVQQPDSLNSQTTPTSVTIAGNSLYDMTNTLIVYKGYPKILVNTLIKNDSRYEFDTDDLIRWFNPSISKEYKIPDLSYEYGWAIRVSRGSVDTTSGTKGTWGWQFSANGGSSWNTLAKCLITNKIGDTYFFKNRVPGTINNRYKFRYIDVSGAPAATYNDFLVLPWNEENEDVTGAYLRDTRDISYGNVNLNGERNVHNYKAGIGYYVGRVYDGSANDIGDNGLFNNRAGIVHVELIASTKPVLSTSRTYDLSYAIADDDTNPSFTRITELFYGANPLIRKGLAAGTDIDVYTPDISSNQHVLGIAIDLGTINPGNRGKWQYTTDGGNIKTDITNSAGNVLVLWTNNISDTNIGIRFIPFINKRDSDGYENIGFYVYDGSDVTTTESNVINTATNKNGKTFTFTSMKTAGTISDASGILTKYVSKFNFTPQLKNTAGYTIEYKFNSSTYSANGLPIVLSRPNLLTIPISDLTAYHIPRDIETNTMGIALGDVSNVKMNITDTDASYNYYGPNYLGDANLLDISNGSYASFTDVSSQPTLYDISGLNATAPNAWFDFNNFVNVSTDTVKKVSYIPNRAGGVSYLTQLTATAQPTYTIDAQGYKGIQFDGTATYLDICGGISMNGQSQTFIVVERRDASANRMPFLGNDVTSTATDYTNIEFGYTTDVSGISLSAAGTSTTTLRANAANSVNTFTSSTFEPIRIWTYQYTNTPGASTTLYLNDQKLTSTSTISTTAFSNLTKPTLGRAIKSTNTYFYKGIIYEVLYYTSVVGAANLTSIQQTLMRKYGLFNTDTILRHGLQAWYDFSNPTTLAYNGTTKSITAVNNQFTGIPDISLSATSGPIFTVSNFMEKTTAKFNNSQELSMPTSLVNYFTGAYITKSYTLVIVDKRDETTLTRAAGFLGDPVGTNFYIGYDTSQNMVVRVGSGSSNILSVNALNITYNATRIWTFTYDATINRYEVFMNNFKLGSKIMAQLTSWPSTSTVIGRGYTGTIGEIALYNVVLPFASTFTDSSGVGVANSLNPVVNNLYKKWIVPQASAAATETLRCYAWYDATDVSGLLDLSSANTTVSRVYNRNLFHIKYTLLQSTEARKPLYNSTENAFQFVSSASRYFDISNVANATDSDRSYTILVVEKRQATFDNSGTFTPTTIIGNQINFGYVNNTGIQCNSYIVPSVVNPYNAATEPRRLWTICYDGTVQKTRVYLNNELVFDRTDSSGSAITWTTRVLGGLTSASQFYNGYIYEMMFFNDPNPSFLSALQNKLIEKWAISAPYVNNSLICWIDTNDTSCIQGDPTTPSSSNIYRLFCKNTGILSFIQDNVVNEPTIQTSTDPTLLGKKTLYFNGNTWFDISASFKAPFIGASSSYTFIFVERGDQTDLSTNILSGTSGPSIYFSLNGSTRVFNYSNGTNTYSVNLIPNYNYVDLPTSVWTITYSVNKLTIFQNMTRVAVFNNVSAPTTWDGAVLGKNYRGHLGEFLLFKQWYNL